MTAKSEDLSFNPELCRNETEVESKLIVQYLLPQLGYPPESWFQEVSFGNIRLDFLAFAVQVMPFTLNSDSPLSLVLEAKHPKENLDKHIGRLKRYLVSLNVRYGLLTNGKLLRIYERSNDSILLKYQCKGKEINLKISEIKDILGREKLNSYSTQSTDNKFDINIDQLNILEKKEKTVKIIAVYHNKGGVGKTTTVVNLAAALSKKGKRVLIIDLDSQANTTFAVGLAKFTDEKDDDLKDRNVYHVISSRAKYLIPEVARNSDYTDPIVSTIPAHISLMEYEKTLIEIEAAKTRMSEKLKQVENDYDIVIIDTPPSLNLFARIALITSDYLIIPSDLKPFANEGLRNVRNFIQDTDEYREVLRKPPLKILGVLPSKISTAAKFVQYTLPKREAVIRERYGFDVLESRIFEREDLAKALENSVIFGNDEIPDPRSILDFKPDSKSAEEFEALAAEVLKKIGDI